MIVEYWHASMKFCLVSYMTRRKRDWTYTDRSQDGRGSCLVVTADLCRRHDTDVVKEKVGSGILKTRMRE
jgi:hypothetical protein